jgi:hypothetical protein
MSLIRRVRTIDKGNVNYIYEEAQINALLGRSNKALRGLREAFERHYPAEYAAGDADLESLHGQPEYSTLIKKYSAKKP